jgi:aspartokinase/homoserine dehydrogenase 1
MKVLKFGGTSVGSAEGILNIKRITEAEQGDIIVVVSAVSGITDKLIDASKMAAQGDDGYLNLYSEITDRHKKLIPQVIAPEKLEEVMTATDKLLGELGDILHGLFLIRELPAKTSDLIVSYGERISSFFMSRIIDGATLFDARELIVTHAEFDKHIVDFPATNELISKAFAHIPKISVVPGFISRDCESGQVSNLGRGGSDYTASIIAAALHAESLEIWTDVDGFMTADPRVIDNAYVIEELSYVEAMELCNFGAKVIYPPTIYPVCHKKIPVRIKNTFNPDCPGSFIHYGSASKDGRVIKGISSINDTCLITVQGLGMVGVIGVDYRIFRALAKNGISVFLVVQASSENSITLGVRSGDAEKAQDMLRKEFAKEQEQGEIDRIYVQCGLATVAIVGEDMCDTPGVDGKLFNTLGRNGINVIACAQGASQIHVSFVVKSDDLQKALSAIHDSFFLSEYQVLNLFLAGVGTVGGNLLAQVEKQMPTLLSQNSLKVKVVGLANSRHCIFDKDGIDISNYRDLLTKASLPSSPAIIKENILHMSLFNSVFVDCTANDAVAGIYKDLLEHNVSVVTANKIAASSSYETYIDLKQTARRRGVKFLFETNVGAGLPIINTMNALINSGDKIVKIEAVLSGTLNFIFNTISEKISLSQAVRMAKEAGYSEPDPRIDLSGTDVIRKLVILSREAGYGIEKEDVATNLFIPSACFDGTIDDFWRDLHKLDSEFEEKRKQLAAQGKKQRFVAKLENGATSIGLQEIDSAHPFYELEGSNNIILITTDRYREYPMMIKGYGAGAAVTAAGVFADIISVVNIR